MNRSILTVLIFLLIACTHTTRHQGQLVTIHHQEGLQSIKLGNITASCKPLPTETGGQDDKKPLHNYQYFDINIEQEKAVAMPKEKELYLDFDIQRDFSLLCGTDSVMPTICQRIQNGFSGSFEYVAGFEIPAAKGGTDMKLVYSDKMFSLGVVAFAYTAKDLKTIPTLATR